MVREIYRHVVLAILFGLLVLRNGLPALNAAVAGRALSVWLPDMTFVLFVIGIATVGISQDRTDDRPSFPRPFTLSDWAFLALLTGMGVAGAFFVGTGYDRLLGGMMAVMGTLGVSLTIYARFWGPVGSSEAAT